MSHFDWRKSGACAGHDEPDIWYATAGSTQGRAEQREAQAICYGCPVFERCGQWAMETHEAWGTWGGMTEGQRRKALRRRGIRLLSPEPQPVRTLQTIWDARTVPLDGGHLGFTGAIPVSFAKRSYTPQQIAYELDRGRPPTGLVRARCGVAGCVLPAHLADQAEREAARAARAALVS